jgi:homoserine O-acetyltransferase/O-succinyltransferase
VKHRVTISGAFPLEGGGTLHDVTVEVRSWGKHRPNAILVCHALTGDANADEWWSGLFGAGKVFDPVKSFIVAMNVIGGCAGTTGPTSERSDGSGHYGASFPAVTIRDMVEVQKAVLDSLGVKQLDLIIGGSMGGMQVLEWAIKYPDMVDRIVPIGVGAAQSAWAIGFSESQRSAINSDPAFAGGNYRLDEPPRSGLGTARMIAMTSYRSPASFDARFGRKVDGERFEVQGYLQHQGNKLVDRFDANSYLRLIDAMDSHDVGRGRGPIEGILHRIEARGLVVGISTDILYPVSEVRALAANLPRCRFAVLDSVHGHDGFLVDVDALNELILSNLQETNGIDEITGHGSAWA